MFLDGMIHDEHMKTEQPCFSLTYPHTKILGSCTCRLDLALALYFSNATSRTEILDAYVSVREFKPITTGGSDESDASKSIDQVPESCTDGA